MDAKYSAGAGPRGAGSSPSATSATSVKRSSLDPASAPRYGFPKESRLLKRPDFRRVYDHGSRLNSSSFAVFRLRRDNGGDPRIGFTTPRALGKAVWRNRIRRRMREAVRLELPGLAGPIDLVFHPRRAILDVDFLRLRSEVSRVFEKCKGS
jgi:ribonuclease P protein component